MGRVSNAWLDGLSAQGDPDADAVIEAHASEYPDLAPADTVKHVAAHLQLPEERRSPAVTRYLAERPYKTLSADESARMDRAQRFFADHALEIGAALFCASLPESYASPRGARVLVLTGRLVSGPVRRVAETAQMLLDVMTTDGLDPQHGTGYDDVRRIRLMHAAVRYYIENDPSVPRTQFLPTPPHGWCAGWGRPLNQEDLLGALLTFTVSVFEVLDKLGVEVDPDDLEAYLFRWKLIGWLLGMADDVLPVDVAEAREMAELIRYRQLGPSNDGRELTRALIEALERAVPFPPMRALVPATVHWYVGTDTAQLIGVGASPWSLVLEGPGRWLSDTIHLDEQHNQFIRTFTRRFGAVAIKGFMDANRGDNRPSFSIPDELAPALQGPSRFKLL
jgi:mpaB/rubber oxygenase-like protein